MKLILVSLLAAISLIEPTRARWCTNQFFVKFYGSDYETIWTHDYLDCQRACEEDSYCVGYTFVISYRYCYKKSYMEIESSTDSKDDISGFCHDDRNADPEITAQLSKKAKKVTKEALEQLGHEGAQKKHQKKADLKSKIMKKAQHQADPKPKAN